MEALLITIVGGIISGIILLLIEYSYFQKERGTRTAKKFKTNENLVRNYEPLQEVSNSTSQDYSFPKRNSGKLLTIATSLLFGCPAIFACSWGVISVTGTPIDVSSNGQQYVETLPPTVGYVLLCLSVLFVAVPVVIGFMTLRKRPQSPANNEPLPPTS